MAINNFKSFATEAGANVISQADYEVLTSLLTGFQSGKASSAQVNKVLRQATFISSVLAQFIADKSGNHVLDDGDSAALVASLIAALKANGASDFLQITNNLGEIAAAGNSAQRAAQINLGIGHLKYGSPLIGSLIYWPLEMMPHEVWTDTGMEFIPYVNQTFDGVRYPLLAKLHPSLRLPADMRGEFVRGWDNGRGADISRVLMSAQGDATRPITGSVEGRTSGTSGRIFNFSAKGAFKTSGASGDYAAGSTSAATPSDRLSNLAFDSSLVVPTAEENRPRNVAWNMIVRAK